MSEEIEKLSQEEEKQLTCPECGKAFQDYRGLTSHARHKHDMDKKEILEVTGEDESLSFYRALVGAGVLLLTILTLGRIK